MKVLILFSVSQQGIWMSLGYPRKTCSTARSDSTLVGQWGTLSAQGCEISDFNLILDSFALHKTHFKTFNALKSISFQAFQIISDYFITDSHNPVCSKPCLALEPFQLSLASTSLCDFLATTLISFQYNGLLL